MIHRLFTRRRGVTAVTVALGMSALSMAFAGPAGAFTAVNGSGSNTIYQVDSGLSDLFNLAPGCNLAGTPQPLDLSCGTPFATGGTVNQPGENGEIATMENPYNDVTYQDPALGSGNGVHQLQGLAGSIPIGYARSSALPVNSHGTTQQTYVQFAIDGVSWVHFTAQGKTKLETSKVTNMTLTNLQAVYNGTLSCSVTKKGVTTNYTMNWLCLGAKTPAPIDCYMAQNGSGTEGTWAYAMGTTATPGCLNDEAKGTAASHTGLFENEVSSITDPASSYYNNDIADAIYFFSYGKFVTECHVKGVAATCPGAEGYTTAMGSVNGIAPSQASIQGTSATTPGDFPITRYLSNVYNNTSATAPATVTGQAALNFTSEYGFLCKPSTASDIDPYTGLNYRYEIETIILQNGFFPIDSGYNATTQQPGSSFSEGAVPNPAQITDPNYQLVDPTYTQANPHGYCLPIAG